MKKIFYIISLLIFTLIMPSTIFAQDSTSTSLSVKVAPGELLPVSVKLSNFGGGGRVDVNITYVIVSSDDITSEKGVEIYKTSETVAVETTNNFVKTIQIPFDTPSGIYTEKTSIIYQGQVAPAESEFKFSVEKKILGIYQSQFILYGGATFLLSIFMVIVGYKLIKNRTLSRFSPIDYSNIPKNDRVFYELISDTILGMRQKVGDRAFDIASNVEGLELDDNGRVIKLTQTPSKVIAELVSGYEKVLGEKVSFSFREPR